MASIPSDFNWRAYLYYNPDVKNAGLNTKELAEQHYSQYGQQEGRNYTLPNFNPEQYLQANEDLRNAFGQNTDYATEHYINYVLSGKEQRPLTPTAPAPTTPVTPTPTTPVSNKQSYSLDANNTALYEKYVNKYPDLLEAWNNPSTDVQKNFNSISDWGFYHYNYGRTDPKKDVRTLEDPVTNAPVTPAPPTRDLSAVIRNIYSVYKDKEPTSEELKYWTDKANAENLTDDQLLKQIHPVTVTVPLSPETTIAGILDNIKIGSQGGDYLTQRTNLHNKLQSLNVDDDIKTAVKEEFRTWYIDNKLSRWDPNTAAKPPSPGGKRDLDLKFYKNLTSKLGLENEWKWNVENDNVDVTERYNNSIDDFYKNHYTQQGKINGLRGYAAESTELAKNYVEEPLDAQKQLIRDAANGAKDTSFDALITTILGPKEITETKKYGALAQNVLKDTISALNKAKAQEKMFDTYRGLDSFAEIMDINKTLANSILGDSGIGGFLASAQRKTEADITTDLEKQLSRATGIQSNVEYNWQKWFDDKLIQKYGIDYTQYQATEDTLDVVNATLKTDPTKIYDTKNKKFTDTFIKEAGFNTSEELVKFLGKQGTTGTNLLSKLQSGNVAIDGLQDLKTNLENQVTTLDSQKNRDLTLTYNGEGSIPEEVKVEASFARQFVDEYLKPRFDYSKSMNEFIDYMDVKNNEKNIFQTTDRITQVKDYAQSLAKAMQGDLDTKFNTNFDTDFYFNPEDKYATLKQDSYGTQKENVNKEWETAKSNPDALVDPANKDLGTWAENAYLYNIDVKDLKDKTVFAKLHYQLIGSKKGYDAALDPSSVLKQKFEDPVYAKAQSIGTVFGDFVKPEEFANDLLKGIDPLLNKDTWKKLLEQYGLDETASLDDVKKSIVENLTTGTAEEIRANIKYLQDMDKTPTQAELGVTYIERPEDKGKSTLEKTELYNIFKKAGYTGTEESFYTDYMPDTSPEDIKLLTDATKNKMPELDLSFDTKDPFAALGKLESLNEPAPKEITTKKDSYFKIGLDDEEEDTSTTSPDSFLSDFTALLKK